MEQFSEKFRHSLDNIAEQLFSAMMKEVKAHIRLEKEQKPIPTEDEKTLLENEVKAFLCNYDKEFDDDAPTYDIAEHFYQLGRNSQKPAEWGEEDEHYFQNLIMAVDSTFSDGNTKNWLLNRLKSLRPQTGFEQGRTAGKNAILENMPKWTIAPQDDYLRETVLAGCSDLGMRLLHRGQLIKAGWKYIPLRLVKQLAVEEHEAEDVIY